MTSEKLKPTPGPWCVSSTNQYQYKVASITSSTGIYADTVPTPNSIMSDATLIAEAGTVFHECGLSPRGLLELCRAMEAALQHCGQMLMKYGINRVDHEAIEDEALEIIQAALAKHKEA